MDIIELYDEKGKIHNFKLLDTFGMDDTDYAVLSSMEKNDDTTYIYRINKSNSDEIILEGIEDDSELKDAVEIYEKLKEESLQ